MEIGIKYCGGCNPSYDRRGAVEKIRASFPKHRFSTASEGRCYDLLFVVCGCAVHCPECEGLHAGKIVYLDSQTVADPFLAKNGGKADS